MWNPVPRPVLCTVSAVSPERAQDQPSDHPQEVKARCTQLQAAALWNLWEP